MKKVLKRIIQNLKVILLAVMKISIQKTCITLKEFMKNIFQKRK